MRATEVDIGLRDGSHTDLIEGTRPEGCKSAGEGHTAITTRHTDSHIGQILLGDEALDETVRESVLELLRVRRVLDIAIESHYSLIILAQFDESSAIGQSSGHLFAQLVSRSFGQLDVADIRSWDLSSDGLDGQELGAQLVTRTLDQRSHSLNHLLGLVAEWLSVP